MAPYKVGRKASKKPGAQKGGQQGVSDYDDDDMEQVWRKFFALPPAGTALPPTLVVIVPPFTEHPASAPAHPQIMQTKSDNQREMDAKRDELNNATGIRKLKYRAQLWFFSLGWGTQNVLHLVGAVITLLAATAFGGLVFAGLETNTVCLLSHTRQRRPHARSARSC